MGQPIHHIMLDMIAKHLFFNLECFPWVCLEKSRHGG